MTWLLSGTRRLDSISLLGQRELPVTRQGIAAANRGHAPASRCLAITMLTASPR